MKRDLEIIINKSEITAGTRGASLGPEAMMTAARTKGSQFFGKYPVTFIEDSNFMLDQDVNYSFAKRIDGLKDIFNRVSDKVISTLKEDKFPLVVASDHGSAGGTIAGIKMAFPNKRLGVVWIDAHGDLHTPFTTPSGNMHGMPLSTALAEDNLPCKKNNVGEYEANLWQDLANLGGIKPKIKAEDLVFISVRDVEAEEIALMQRLNITNHTVDSVRTKGNQVILDKIKAQLSDCDLIYVSFDVDSMDPEFTSHGTGTPVDHGLRPEEAEFFLTELAKMDKTVCIEFVEVNPCLDEKINKMAEVAFDLLDKVTDNL